MAAWNQEEDSGHHEENEQTESMTPMSWTNIAFVFVYLGLILGGIPGLRIDRAGIAILGAILLLATGTVSEKQAIESVDFPTMALLFGLMVLAAQFQLGGFYGAATRKLAELKHQPLVLLAAVVIFAGMLSSMLSNDVVCVAVAPPLLNLCGRHRLNPVPFLLALAGAANVGSTATLIGNPQNILIGQQMEVSFVRYILVAAMPTLIGLGLTWAVITLLYRGRWEGPEINSDTDEPAFDLYQTLKGTVILGLIVITFLSGIWPRELVALAGGAFLLLSAKFHSRQILGLVDWPLLMLFISLFVVNGAFQKSGEAAMAISALQDRGLDLSNLSTLFVVTPILSNIVSNVPAVMLLMPTARSPDAGIVMAISSTLAGNLIIVGSVANIIVVETARRAGIPISFREHARVGIPLTLSSLMVAGLWLWWVL